MTRLLVYGAAAALCGAVICALVLMNAAVGAGAGVPVTVVLILFIIIAGLCGGAGFALMRQSEKAKAERADNQAQLLRDFHHQIKNNLQLVSSVIRLHSRETDDPALKAILNRLQDRIMSLGPLHQGHVIDDGTGLICAASLLDEVIDNAERPFKKMRGGLGVNRQFDDVLLTDKVAGPLCVLVADVLADLQRMHPHPRGLHVALRNTGDAKLELFVSFARKADEQWTSQIGAKIRAACVVQLNGTQTETVDDSGKTVVRIAFAA